MKRSWKGKRWMVYIVSCLVVLVLTTIIMINRLDCSMGLCDGPGYGILIVEINFVLLFVFSIIYWIVVHKLNG